MAVAKPILEDTELVDISNTETLQKLQDQLKDSSYDEMAGRSGSNLQAGVEAARMHLNSDKTVDSADKYMIILSDGGARMWYQNGQAMSQTYFHNSTDGTIDWNDISDFMYFRYPNNQPARDFSEVWNAGQNGKVIGAYAMTEEQKNIAKVAAKNGEEVEGVATQDVVKNSADYYTTLEAATYYAATSIVEAAKETNVIFVSYPYHGKETNHHQYAESFKSWLAENKVVTRYDNADMDEAKNFLCCERRIDLFSRCRQ